MRTHKKNFEAMRLRMSSFQPIITVEQQPTHGVSDGSGECRAGEPSAIFRDCSNQDHISVLPTEQHVFCVQRANSIHSTGVERQKETTASSTGLITPFPFTPTASKEELEERERLTESLEWNKTTLFEESAQLVEESSPYSPAVHVDYAQFFESVSSSVNNIEIMEVDDFTLYDDVSVASSDSMESIARDPISFWDQGVAIVASPTSNDRVSSPTAVSLGSSDQRLNATWQ